MVETRSDKKWDGFRPQPYFISYTYTSQIKVNEIETAVDGKQTPKPTTLWEILKKLRTRRVESVEFRENVQITTDAGPIVIEGRPINGDFLELLIELQKEGINVLGASWFWYARDHCLDDGQVAYAFFLVHDGRIVNEEVTIFDSHYSGFDPALLETEDHSKPLWSHERVLFEAGNRYWYRKFYSETLAGQMMVLRPDEPELFYYGEGRSNTTIETLTRIEARLSRIGVLLWVVIALLAATVLERVAR